MKQFSLSRMALVAFVLIGLATMGFQCSSPNITSGKLYLQQYQSGKNKEKLEKAQEAFEKEIKEKPNSAEGWYWIGHVYAEKKEYGKLQEAWSKAKQLGGKTTQEIESYRLSYWGQAFNHGANTFKKAQLTKNKALYKEAAETFGAAVMLEPDSSAKYNAYVYQAFALMGMGDTEAAREPLAKQIEENPTAEAYSALGQLIVMDANAMKKGGDEEGASAKYDEALTLLNRAIADFPENPDLNNELLNTYIAADRVKEAVEKFKAYADNNPKDASAQYAAGTAYLQINEFENAATYLDRALNIDPENISAMYNIAVAYLRLGANIRSADDSTDPDAQQTDYKSVIRKAIPYIQKLVEMQPDIASNWDLAGKIYATIGMTKEAEDAYNKADALRK
ncbi:MAG: tetratricopeptide repeat protein [Bacteroidota bacterium]|nr:tetratricopeptide repeat protein [Bacteroidota bacterium]